MNNRPIHLEFEKMAMVKKNNIAVQTEFQHLSYFDLNISANKLADLLKKNSIAIGDVVGVFLNDNIAQIVSLLGVFKSGSIYLPLDKKYKKNHWNTLFENICPKGIIISREYLGILEEYCEQFNYTFAKIIVIDSDVEENLKYSVLNQNEEEPKFLISNNELSSDNLDINLNGDDSNYIFFTSGSTGKPKAVLGSHKGLSNFINWFNSEFEISEKDRIGLLASFSFDASLHDIFSALSLGATLFIPSTDTKNNISKLRLWIRDNKIGVLHMVPTLFRILMIDNDDVLGAKVEEFSSLKYILLAGEKLYFKDYLNWKKKYGSATKIVNLYGTTETTCLSTFNILSEEQRESEICHVGKPIANTAILILNAKNKLCRINEEGSVYIRTPYTSKGYYNDDKLTSSKFIQNPLVNKKDIIYRTGDYGKYDRQRNVVISGREDNVIKINGVRIDLNTVEKTLLRLNSLDKVKCIIKKDTNNNLRIVCFFVSKKLTADEVKKHCYQFLSRYEVPSFFLKLPSFPINSNGKIDINILSNIDLTNCVEKKKNPSNEAEKKLVRVWEEVLGTKGVFINSDFISLGGNSMKIVQLAHKIQYIFDVSLSIEDLFNNSILEQQAKLIMRSKTNKFNLINKANRNDGYLLSPTQTRLWILSQFDEKASAYNMFDSFNLKGKFCSISFHKAVESVINRHEVLRTVFKENNQGELRQWIIAQEDIAVDLKYIDFKDEIDPEEKASLYISEDVVQCFDLQKGPLIKFRIFKITENHHILYYKIHHIICDEVSKGILKRDILEYYKSYENIDESVVLPELVIQYKDYAGWKISKLENNEYSQHKHFWLKELSGELPIMNINNLGSRPRTINSDGQRVDGYLDSKTTESLNSFIETNKGTEFMGVLAVWYILFYKYTAEQDLIVGTPVSGREHKDLNDQLGCYINTLPLRFKINPNDSFVGVFQKVRSLLLQVYQFQDYPFEEILDNLNIGSHKNRNAIFDVMISYHNVHKNIKEDIDENENKILDQGNVKSKLDLMINGMSVGNNFYFIIDFNKTIFDVVFVRQLFQNYKNLVSRLLESPDVSIKDINYHKEVVKSFRKKNIQKLKSF